MRSGKQKTRSAKRKTHSLELKLQVLQQLKAGAKLEPATTQRIVDLIRAGNYLEVAATAAGIHRWAYPSATTSVCGKVFSCCEGVAC